MFLTSLTQFLTGLFIYKVHLLTRHYLTSLFCVYRQRVLSPDQEADFSTYLSDLDVIHFQWLIRQMFFTLNDSKCYFSLEFSTVRFSLVHFDLYKS